MQVGLRGYWFHVAGLRRLLVLRPGRRSGIEPVVSRLGVEKG